MQVEQTALLSDPTAVAAYLAGLIALVFWLSGLPRLARIFDVTPPVIYAYFLPTLSTTFGITPASSPAYDWMVRYLLPFALLLLMITFGIAYPWVQARTMAFHTDRLVLHGSTEFEGVLQEMSTATATGAELAEMFDVEIVGADLFGL